jgi:hypothetical protein
MESMAHDHPKADALKEDLTELRKAVGLEKRESA